MKSVAIVGFGRVGAALALQLKAAKWPVAVAPSSVASRKKARALKLTLATNDDIAKADICMLAVPDAAVASIVVPKGPAVVHCAGALSLDVLGDRPRGSFHPLVAISSPKDPLEGHWVAISASERTLELALWAMARALKMNPLQVPEAGRAAYHAGAVMSAGLLVALLDAAAEATGLPRDEIEPALIALASSALHGAKERGLAASLTGPVVRGDFDVVKRHLEALPPELAALYRFLSLRSLNLAEKLSPLARARLAQALDASQTDS